LKKCSGTVGIWDKESKLLYQRKVIAEKCLEHNDLEKLREDI